MNTLYRSGLLLSVASCCLLADPSIELTPEIESFVPGYRINVKAKIADESGISVARTYFKSGDVVNFVFLPMECEDGFCQATIPALSRDTKILNYAVLVKNGENEVYKTQTFTAEARDDDLLDFDYQSKDKSGKIEAKTENADAPNDLNTYSDNVTITTVEESQKLGTMATTLKSASVAGGATTAAIVGGVAVVGGGVALVANNKSDKHDSHQSSHQPQQPQTTPTIDITGVEWRMVRQWASYSANSHRLFSSVGNSINQMCMRGQDFTHDAHTATGVVTWSPTNHCSSISGVSYPTPKDQFLTAAKIGNHCVVNTYTDHLIDGTCQAPVGPDTMTFRMTR